MSLKDFKSIGDQLTDAEFNGIISMCRNFITHKDEFDIQDTVIGDYGKYCFDIQDTTVLDSGLLVTNETISAEPKVKLMNSIFKNSTYTLILEVIHYTGASILDDDPTDFKVTETLEIELIPNTWVDIPLTDIEAGYIISFDTDVVISHDRTEIRGNYVTGLSVSVDKPIIQIGEDAVLSVMATDLDTLPVIGKSIQIYDGGTLLDNLTTDSTGIATKTVTGTGSGRHEYIARYKSSVESSPVGILDAIFYDQATTGHKNTNWNNFSNRLTVVTDENGTSLTSNGSQNGYYFVNGDDPFIFTDYTVEFDVIDFGGTPRWYHQNQESANETVFTLSSYLTENCHVKITVENGVAKLYVDGVEKETKTLDSAVTNPYEIAFRLPNAVTNTITYANFMVYPYEETGLILTANKQTISYYDSETSTLTATYVEGTGAIVELYDASDDTLIATMNDEGDGTYTYTYTSTGAGDISFYAKVGSLVSETCVIEDCLFYGINVNAFTVPSSTTFTSDGTKITATTSASSEKVVYFNHTFSNTDDWLFETELAQTSSPQGMGIVWNDNSFYGGEYPSTNEAYSTMTGTAVRVSHTFSAGDKFKVVRQNGVTTAYINNESIQSLTTSHKTSFKIGYFINKNRTQYYKNIKIKLL